MAVHIGLILFNDNYKKHFLFEFYTKFPDLRNYNKKSTRINGDYLYDIIKFFDSKRLRMVSYKFEDFRWKQHEKRLNDLFKEVNLQHIYRSNFYRFYEKLMGILYFYAITQIGKKNQIYTVTACAESGLDIWEILNTIKKMAKIYGWDVRPNVSIRKIEHLLKMADYVAGSSRKIEEFKLERVNRYTILKDPIKDVDLKEIFRIIPKTTKKYIKSLSL